jgi:hypothetical protein
MNLNFRIVSTIPRPAPSVPRSVPLILEVPVRGR